MSDHHTKFVLRLPDFGRRSVGPRTATVFFRRERNIPLRAVFESVDTDS